MNSTSDPDADLTAALEKWLAECEATLAQSLDELAHLVEMQRWHVQSDGGLRRYPFTPMYRFGELHRRIITQSEAWPEVERLAQKHGNFSKHCNTMIFLPDGSGGMFTLPELCLLLLPRLTIRDERLAVANSSETIASRVKALIDAINSETVVSWTIWPITGVAAQQAIHLDDRTQFREMTADEKLHCLNMGIVGLHRQTAIPADNARWFGLCRLTSAKKLFGQDGRDVAALSQRSTENEQVLEDFLAIVPLVNDRPGFHAGGIQSAPLVETGGMLAHGVTGRGVASNGFRFYFVDEGAVLSDSSVVRMKSLWSFIRKAGGGFKVRVANAARRLFYAETRTKLEDALVDLMISAESLYQEDTQELSYKMPLNAALWADGDDREKMRVFDTFRQAYKLRSNVVHGSTVSVEKVRDVVELVKPVLRDGIRKAIVHLERSSEPPKWEKLIFPSSSE